MTEMERRTPRFLTALNAAFIGSPDLGVSTVGSAALFSAAGVDVTTVGVACDESSRRGLPRPRPDPGVVGVLGVLGVPPRPAPPPRLPPGFFHVQTR